MHLICGEIFYPLGPAWLLLMLNKISTAFRGRSEMTSAIFDPLPLVSLLEQSLVLKSCNLSYYVRIWETSSPFQPTSFVIGPLSRSLNAI